MSQENVEIIRSLNRAFNEGGMSSEIAVAFFDVDAVFEEPPEQPAPRVARGREETAKIFTLRDGKITRMQSFWERASALKAAGLSE